MRFFAVLAIAWAGLAWAEPAQITYHGLTLGAPFPQSIVPHQTEALEHEDEEDELPLSLKNLCAHGILLPEGSGQINVMTQACDGPVAFIDVTQFSRSFFDPAIVAETLAPEIAGLIFEETTLSKVRTLFCSEGLVDGAEFGQDDADAVGLFRFAYGIENTSYVAVFGFQLPLAARYQTYAPGEVVDLGVRDTAQLVSVTLMVNEIFNLMAQNEPLASAGYIPLPETLKDTSFGGLNCPVA